MRDRTRQWLADAIRAAAAKHDFGVLAYVFMPEHVHLLLCPHQREYNISQILTSIKTPVTRKSRWFVLHLAPSFAPRMLDVQPDGQQALRFWQRGGGYDRNIYTARELWEKLDYIHRNPVTRRLVERHADWRWSSAADYAGVRTGPLAIEFSALPDRP